MPVARQRLMPVVAAEDSESRDHDHGHFSVQVRVPHATVPIANLLRDCLRELGSPADDPRDMASDSKSSWSLKRPRPAGEIMMLKLLRMIITSRLTSGKYEPAPNLSRRLLLSIDRDYHRYCHFGTILGFLGCGAGSAAGPGWATFDRSSRILNPDQKCSLFW
jgi:hypothetical protein